MAIHQLRKRGQSIVEIVVGIVFLVPIALFLLDAGVLVLANFANDGLANSAARAAASAIDLSTSQGSQTVAYTAALNTANQFAESPIISKTTTSFLTAFSWNDSGTPATQGTWPSAAVQPGIGDVAVVTSMKVNLPIPFPFVPGSFNFTAAATQPIISIEQATTGSGVGVGGQGHKLKPVANPQHGG